MELENFSNEVVSREARGDWDGDLPLHPHHAPPYPPGVTWLSEFNSPGRLKRRLLWLAHSVGLSCLFC